MSDPRVNQAFPTEVATMVVRCPNPACSELDVPKEVPTNYITAETMPIWCGVCGTEIPRDSARDV